MRPNLQLLAERPKDAAVLVGAENHEVIQQRHHDSQQCAQYHRGLELNWTIHDAFPLLILVATRQRNPVLLEPGLP